MSIPADRGLALDTNLEFASVLFMLAKAIRHLDTSGPLSSDSLKHLHNLLRTHENPARPLVSEIHFRITGQRLEDLGNRQFTLPTDDLTQLKSMLRDEWH